MTDLAYQKASLTHVDIQRGDDLIVFPPDEGGASKLCCCHLT